MHVGHAYIFTLQGGWFFFFYTDISKTLQTGIEVGIFSMNMHNESTHFLLLSIYMYSE